jgi:small conductance mechanosensitive channel
MKKGIIALLLLILIAPIFAQEWVPENIKSLDTQFINLMEQYKALNDFSPDKIPGFEELPKINKLVEKLNFNKRKFDLLIKEYNILEDKLFPAFITLSEQKPELSSEIIKKLVEYRGKSAKSIYFLQREINNIGLYIDRIGREIERFQQIKKEGSSVKDKQKENISISAKIEFYKSILKEDIKNINFEKDKLKTLEEKAKKKEAKIVEKRGEILQLKDKAKKTNNPVEAYVYRILAKVRNIRIEGFEIPKLNTIRASIYLSQSKLNSLDAQISEIKKQINLLKKQSIKQIKKMILKGFFVIIIAIIVVILLTKLIKQLGSKFIKHVEKNKRLREDRKKRYYTLFNISLTLIKITLWTLAVLWVLGELNIDYAPFLVAAGGVSLAVGFGAQSLVKDIVSGFFILMEEQLAIGDVVEINGKTGTVERISLRTITVRSFDGSVHIIPNGSISSVTNLTYKWARTVLKIGASYDDDPDKVIKALNDVGKAFYKDDEWKNVLKEEPSCLGVDSFGDSAIVYTVIAKTKPGNQWAVGREFRKRIKKKFDKEGIDIPYNYINIIDKTQDK